MIINVTKKEIALLKILKNIEFLEKQIEDTITINGITLNISIFNIIQFIKSSYINSNSFVNKS